MIGQSMEAGGFGTLASHFPDRTVITYDPGGLGRSTRKDGRVDEPQTRPSMCTPSSRGGGPRLLVRRALALEAAAHGVAIAALTLYEVP